MANFVDLVLGRSLSDAEIAQLLSAKPEALSIVTMVSHWYGHALVIDFEPANGRPSSLKIGPWDDDIELLEREGHVKLGPVRMHVQKDQLLVPSLFHECFHLKTYIDGYPFAYRGRDQDDEQFRLSFKVINAVAHHLFFQDFLSLDFAVSDFLYDVGKIIDFAILRQQIEQATRLAEHAKYRRGKWNYVYLCQRVLQRLGIADRVGEVTSNGKDFFPTAADDALWIDNWLEKGEFLMVQNHAAAINRLLLHIDLGTARFGKLDSRSDGIWLTNTPEPSPAACAEI